MFKNKSKKFATILPFIGLLLFVLISYNSHSQPLRSVTYNVSTAEIVIPSVSLEFPYGITVGGTNVASEYDIANLSSSIAEISDLSSSSVGSFGTPGTNSVISGFERLIIVQPVTYVTETFEVSNPNIDFLGGYSHSYIIGTNDISLSASNIPTDLRYMPVTITNTLASVINVSWSDWIWPNLVPITSIPGNSTLKVILEAYDEKINVSGEGAQTAQLEKSQGGTGNTKGVADAPDWTAQEANISSGTNYSVNLNQGTFQIISVSDNVHLVSSAGRTTDSTTTRWQEILIENWSGVNRTLSWNGDWNVTPADIGSIGTYTLSNSTITLAKLRNWGPSETNVVLEIIGRTIIGVGAAEPPDVFDNLIAAWLMEDNSTDNQTDSVGGYTITRSHGTFTAQSDGMNNFSWSAGSGTMATNPATALKPFGTTRTYTGWARPGTISDARQFIGTYESGASELGWRMGYNALGHQQINYSYDGTTQISDTVTGNVFTTGEWHFWAVIVKDSSYIKYTMANVSAGELPNVTTEVLSGALNASTAPFSLWGTPTSTGLAGNPMSGRMDEIYVFDVELTQSQLEELYDGGIGKFYTAP